MRVVIFGNSSFPEPSSVRLRSDCQVRSGWGWGWHVRYFNFLRFPTVEMAKRDAFVHFFSAAANAHTSPALSFFIPQ